MTREKVNANGRLLRALCAALLILMAGCARHAFEETKLTADAPPAGAVRPVALSAEDANAAEPAVAAAREGGLYVVWVEHRAGGQSDVMLARLGREGEPQGAAVRVNPEPGGATAWRGDPPTVATGKDGAVYVGWTARAGAAADHATDLYLSTSRDGGRTFASHVEVNDDAKPAVHGMHSLAVADDGRVYLAWLDERNVGDTRPTEHAGGHHTEGNREVFMTFSTDGGRTFAPNRRVAADACPCCKTALAVGRDGRLYVGWRQVLPGDFRHVAVSSSADGGETFSPTVIVSDDHWMLSGCPVSGPALSATADGALRVLWYSEGEAGQVGLYWAESRDGGGTFSPRRLLAAGPARGTPVLLADAQQSAAIWETHEGGAEGVSFARVGVDASDARNRKISDEGELPAAVVTGDQIYVVFTAKKGEHLRVLLQASPRNDVVLASQ